MTCWVGHSHFSYHPAKFGAQRPSESGDITFLISHRTTWSMCHVTWWVRYPHPKNALRLIYKLIVYMLLVNKIMYKWPHLYIKA